MPGEGALGTFFLGDELPNEAFAKKPKEEGKEVLPVEETTTGTATGETGNEIYALIEPLTYADASFGFPLKKYVEGIGAMWDDINPIIRDKHIAHGQTIPGYAVVMNLQECPPEWLPWLGQFIGVTAPPHLTTLDRELITAATGMNRGTPEAIKAAVAIKLTGAKRVDMFERSEGKAYKLVIVTYTDETPSPELIENLLKGEDVVPAGIVVEYKCLTGWIYEAIQKTSKTYQQLKEEFATYQKLALDTP